MTLDAEDIEAIVAAVTGALGFQAPPAGALVDAQTLAARLGVSRDYVYRHRRELGGRRIGTGPKSPLRFDLEHAEAAIDVPHAPVPKPSSFPGASRQRRPTAPLLPVRERAR